MNLRRPVINAKSAHPTTDALEEARELLAAGGWPATYWHLCIEQRAIKQKIMEKVNCIDPAN